MYILKHLGLYLSQISQSPVNPAEEGIDTMQKIIVETFEGNKELAGECIKSELYWSSNVEERIPLRNAGQFATKQVPTDCFNEEWKFDGFDEIVKLTKFITLAGTEYVAKEESDKILEKRSLSAAAAMLGARGGAVGGKSTSPAKQTASRNNGRLGGRPHMSEAEARKAGYEIVRGSYVGTNDDRADRWYIQRIESNTIDRRGDGFATKRDALDTLSERL
jgi:hypothetical protein